MAARLSGNHGCTCGHWTDDHVRRTGRCKGADSYGFACECVGFEHDDSCMELDGADEDERQKPHPYPDTHYRHLLDDNGHVDPKEPE